MYIAPYIDSTGIHLPLYSDILGSLIDAYKNIYGQDIYLGNDAADYQWISIIANRLNDVELTLQQDYNNRSPLTAVGVPLDGLVKENGLTRKVATYSSCVVIISGLTGIIITNGVVKDLSGYSWNLPTVTTIGEDGTIEVSATCQTLGTIAALPNTITSIVTPQYGWLSVNNDVAAVLGQPVETDAQLRARQSLSTRLASHTMLAGTVAGIAAVASVLRYNVHENYTNFTDEQGTPAHSITAVVEGGTDDDVAVAIFSNRGIGCDTNGETSVVVVDPDTLEEMTINFMRPQYLPIYATLHITRLVGYTDSVTTQIEEAVCNYLNGLQIGQNLTISALYGAALSVMPSLVTPIFSITVLIAGTSEGTQTTSDIILDFNEVTQGILGSSPAYITVILL
jgi:uncharacterized phage protein gp47/JayE